VFSFTRTSWKGSTSSRAIAAVFEFEQSTMLEPRPTGFGLRLSENTEKNPTGFGLPRRIPLWEAAVASTMHTLTSRSRTRSNAIEAPPRASSTQIASFGTPVLARAHETGRVQESFRRRTCHASNAASTEDQKTRPRSEGNGTAWGWGELARPTPRLGHTASERIVKRVVVPFDMRETKMWSKVAQLAVHHDVTVETEETT